MRKRNICPFCLYSEPNKNCGMGLVDCTLKCCCNAYKFECKDYRENERLTRLKEEAVAAIQDYEKAAKSDPEDTQYNKMLALKACTFQDAVAIMLDISYDEAAEMLHEEAQIND